MSASTLWCIVLPYVRVLVTRRALVAHRHSFAAPRCRTVQYHRTFVLSVSLWNDLEGPAFEGDGMAGFKSSDLAFLLAISAPILPSAVFSFSSFGELVV